MKLSLCATALVCLAAAAAAQELPDGVGVVTPSGSRFTSVVSPGDQDDYVFEGFPGMALAATVQVARHFAPEARLEVRRPDGSLVTAADGLVLRTRGNSLSAKFTLDATGVWKARVSAPQAVSVPYAFSMTTTKPRFAPVTLEAPDANGQFRFTIPARGGARIGWRLTRTGAPPTFHSLVDPLGRPVQLVPTETTVRNFRLPIDAPFGDYTLTFDTTDPASSAQLARTVALPKPPKPRKAKLAAEEPVIVGSVQPSSGGPGAVLSVRVANLVDPNAPKGPVTLALGGIPLSGTTIVGDDGSVQGKLPDDLAVGTYDLVVTSTSGQPAVLHQAFQRVPAPVIDSIDPLVGSALGGFDILVTGRNFRAGTIAILIDGIFQPLTPSFVDDATVRFTSPPHGVGLVSIGVRDVGSNLQVEQTTPAFEYVSTPAIGKVSPALVPVLSNDTITLDGVFFSATDKVFFETTTPGVFEDLAATQTTYVDGAHHRFAAPVRPKGEYRVYVEDDLGRPNPRKPKSLTYFSFADATAASGLGSLGADPADAASSALTDLDGDGDLDLVLSRRGGATAETTSQTRLLLNDGHGAFTDATAGLMPVAGADDWRADKVQPADIDGDGHVDLVLTTNSLAVPPAGRSHTRILLSEVRGGTGPNAGDRLFRDRTADVMPPARSMKNFGAFGGSGATYVSDDWRGLDLWIGDLDKTGAGPPEIVVTHDETKNDNGTVVNGFMTGVYCGNYCATRYASGYAYFFYWGGTRAFTWDKTARGGQGRYRLDPNALPRSVGVYPWSLPGFGPGTFTPFAGKRVAVGDLDHDGKPDIAVLSDKPVLVKNQWASGLQVALQGFDATVGSKFTDLTPKLTALGYDTSGDALAIGVTGWPNGAATGVIAVSWAQRQANRSLSLYRFVEQSGLKLFEDVTYAALPLPTADDGLEATQIRFVDVDQDGDQDLVLLAPAASGGMASAFRVLRNEEAAGLKGVYRRSFDGVTGSATTPTDRHEGDALAIGDVSDDGFLDFVVSRRTPAGAGPDTRVLSTTK